MERTGCKASQTAVRRDRLILGFPARAMLKASGNPMHNPYLGAAHVMSTRKRWSRARARSICPRWHLRVLPTRTRPSLFGGD